MVKPYHCGKKAAVCHTAPLFRLSCYSRLKQSLALVALLALGLSVAHPLLAEQNLSDTGQLAGERQAPSTEQTTNPAPAAIEIAPESVDTTEMEPNAAATTLAPTVEPPPAQKKTPPLPAVAPSTSISTARPLPYPKVSLKRRPHLNHLYQYDEQPLGDRIPVVLVPGRAQEAQFFSWWQKLGWEAKKQPHFQKQYKLLLYLYDSKQGLPLQTEEFEQEFRSLLRHLPPERNMVVVSYSLGGLIVRDMLTQKPELLDRVDQIYGIGVPYHGSPMFNTRWFSEFSKHPSPLRRFWDKVFYRAYLADKKNLLNGLYWANFDQSEPFYEGAQWRIPIDPERVENFTLAYADDEAAVVEAFKDKLVIYASYLNNPYVSEEKPRFNRNLQTKLIQIPKAVLGTILPFYGFTVHSVFDYMNLQMANLPTYTPGSPEGSNTNLYRYNDGVIPLSSALYLPPRRSPYQEELQELAAMDNVCRVRIFEDIDHVDLGHYRALERYLVAQDVTRPAAGERTPFGWLFYDLHQLHQNPNNPCE